MKKYMFIAIITVIMFLAGCSGSKTDARTAAKVDNSVVSEMPAPPDFDAIAGIKDIDMTAFKFGFEPNRIVVKKGDTVKLHITSTDVKHGFAIDEYGINEILPPGQVVNIDFTADKTGTFEFYCAVLCGAGHGNMRGELVVE